MASCQFDTGMSWFGLTFGDFQGFSVFDGLNLQLLMSYMAFADMPDHSVNARQWKRFVEMTVGFSRAGVLWWPHSGLFLIIISS